MNMTRARDQYLFGLIPKDDFELTDSMREFGLTVDTLYATTPKGRQRLATIARGGDRIVAMGGVEFTTLERLLYSDEGVELINEVELSNEKTG